MRHFGLAAIFLFISCGSVPASGNSGDDAEKIRGKIVYPESCESEGVPGGDYRVVAQEANPLRQGKPLSLVGSIDAQNGTFVINYRQLHRDYVVRLLKKPKSQEVDRKQLRSYGASSDLIFELACPLG